MTTYMRKIPIPFPLARQEMNYKAVLFILGMFPPPSPSLMKEQYVIVNHFNCKSRVKFLEVQINLEIYK